MSSLSAERMQDIYSGLTSSISGSVQNIRHKQEQAFNALKAPTTEEAPKSLWGGFSLNNYAVSYLQPQALFSLHQLREEDVDGRLKGRSAQKQEVEDNGPGSQTVAAEEDSNVTAASFLEVMQNLGVKPDAATVAGIYGQRQGAASSFSAETFSGADFAMGEVKYANDQYNFNYNLSNSVPEVKIEFMHKYNRSYDYRV